MQSLIKGADIELRGNISYNYDIITIVLLKKYITSGNVSVYGRRSGHASLLRL